MKQAAKLGLLAMVGLSGCGGTVAQALEMQAHDLGAVQKATAYQFTPLVYSFNQEWETKEEWERITAAWRAAFVGELGVHLGDRAKQIAAEDKPADGVIVNVDIYNIFRKRTALNNAPDQVYANVTVLDPSGKPLIEAKIDANSDRWSALNHTFHGRMELAALNLAQGVANMLKTGIVQ